MTLTKIIPWCRLPPLIVVVSASVAAFFYAADDLLALLSWDYWLAQGTSNGRSKVVRNIGLLIAAFGAGALAFGGAL
jgi:hypothetical protein